MFGLISAKKFTAAMDSLNSALDLLASGVDERLQKVERQQRRQQAALESLVDSQEAALSALKRLTEENPSTAALLSLAENFILWRSGQNSSDPGLDIIAAKLDDLLEQHGLAALAEPGVPFDPVRHEAVDTRHDPDQPPDAVLEIVRPGFLFEGRVLRAAAVVVNKEVMCG